MSSDPDRSSENWPLSLPTWRVVVNHHRNSFGEVIGTKAQLGRVPERIRGEELEYLYRQLFKGILL